MIKVESSVLELKRGFTDDIKKSVIAFANTDGGMIYVGIADDGTIVGIQDIDINMLRLSNMIRDSIKPDITMFISYDIEIIEEKKVIKVTIQKGTASPYYILGKGIRPEGVFVRHGASSVPASETLILKMIKDTDGVKYEDVRSLNQELTFQYAQNEFNMRGVPFGTSQLKTLKITTTDEVFTNLGLLISEQCPHTVKLAVFEGSTKTIFKDRREFEGSLLKQLNDAYEYIDIYNRTRAEFSGLYRIDKRDYPTDAIREALLNSLVHRDYAFSGSTLISIFDDRIEFISIGGLVKGISFNDIMLGVSISRNENLANIFYRLKLIEAYGTGIPTIFRSYDESKIKPQIEVTDNAYKITLPNTNAITKNIDLSEKEIKIMDLFNTKESINRKDVESILSISQTMANRILRELVMKGLIITVGQGKNTKYINKK